jgi:bleomycin hydrolase
MGKGKMNLSEMYIARRAYTSKADRFVRMMGKTNFGQGGAFHDVMNVIKDYGLMPDAAYSGFIYGQTKHNHSELEEILIGMLNTLVKLPEGKLSPAWKQAVEGILDAYLGKLPEKVDYNGKSISPMEFRNQLGINPADYVEISSFTHHPFYEQFVLEVPDNWAWNKVYNVPLDEMEQIMENAVTNNYSIAWAADVSEPYFSHKNGLAIVPEKEMEAMSKEEKESLFTQVNPQRIVTQEMRQKAFDNLSTQDDHGMHITGLVKDQNGQKFYIVKNSWGAENNECGGYLYCSAQYIRYKTTCIMVHKNAIPQAIATKLKLTK